MSENPGAAAAATPVASSEATASADVSTIAATLAAEMPEVQPHAVEAARQESQSQIGLDVNGDKFDSAIHVAGPDGNGKKNAKGAWERKRGRKAGTASTSQAAPNAPKSRVGSGEPPPPSKEQLARISGAGAANLFFVACMVIGGEEWQPQIDPKTGLNEKVMMESVFGDYFVATGKQDLPPGWALVAGIGMYAAKRFTMPKTLNRLQKVKMWIGGKIYAWRMRKRKSTVQPYETIDGERDPRDRRVWTEGASSGNPDSRS